MRIERENRKGSISVPQEDGSVVLVEIDLEIERTYHDDGRRDVTIKVPTIDTKAGGETLG